MYSLSGNKIKIYIVHTCKHYILCGCKSKYLFIFARTLSQSFFDAQSNKTNLVFKHSDNIYVHVDV